jgi:cyclic beta-1,2-glucan synthetase
MSLGMSFDDTALERARAAPRDSTARRAIHRPVYGAVFGAVLVATVAAIVLLAASGGAPVAWRVLAGFYAVPLGVLYAGRIARATVTRLTRPVIAHLPRLALPASVPEAWRTLVVLPAIVQSPERARELLGRLARLARELDDPHVRLALLADFGDAPTRTTSTDGEILREEERLVERINAELRDAAGDRVIVLHRERTWFAADRTWMGWERKRGKLLELHRLLCGRTDTGYRWTFGELATKRFPYVFTLDEANWLPRSQLLSVLRVAAHPANHAELDADTGRLVHGYAIFQPIVVPASVAASGGERGIGLAPIAAAQDSASMRFYFDVLGVGVFQGKGLLDVRACHALLDDAFPPGEVLQHDVLEGFVARTAKLDDAYVLEAQPLGYLAQVQRGYRWMRGYFQTLRWILPRVRGGDGVPRVNPLGTIDRLFLVELALPEVARPASLALLIAGWLALPRHVGLWTVLVCPPLAVLLTRLCATTLAAIADAVRRRLRPSSHGGRPAPGVRWLVAETFTTVVSQATLPYEAVMVADAFGRAAWRMLVSRRHLLDWPTVSRLQAKTHLPAPREYRRIQAACYAIGVCTITGVAVLHPMHLLLALPFAASWIGAPFLVAWLDAMLTEPEIREEHVS